MRKKFSIQCVLLAAILALALAAGCSRGGKAVEGSSSAADESGASSGGSGQTGESSSAAADAGGGANSGGTGFTRDKLVITATMEGNTDAKDSLVEQAYQKLMSEKLGREIEIQYTMVPGSDYESYAGLLLATGDLTDFFQIPFLFDYSKAASEGFFLDLAPHMDELSNYFGYVERMSGGLANVMTSAGNIYVLCGIGLPRFPEDHGMLPDNLTMYRYDIFQKNGIAIPETLDDVYEAAKKLKEIYPNTYPVNVRWKDLRSLFRANHTDNGVYWNGSEYVMGLFDEGYKEAVEYARKLYTEGLLDPEYLIETDDTLKSKQMTDRTFIMLHDWFTTPGENTRLSDSDQIFAAALHPNNPKYGTAWHNVQRVNEVARGIFENYAISSKVADVAGLLEFLDAGIEDDVIRLVSWGIEGETYELDSDGNPYFVDEIMKADDPWVAGDKWGMRASRNKRPGVFTPADALSFVGLAANDWLYYEGALHIEPIEKSPFYLSIPYPDNEYTPPSFNEPSLQYTDEEAAERSQMLTILETYRDEQQAAFVSGAQSMDNWDAYMNTIRSLIDVERFLQIYNDAARRYYAAN